MQTKTTIALNELNFSVSYLESEGYLAERNAKLLVDAVRNAGDSAELFRGYAVEFDNTGADALPASTGLYRIRVGRGKKIRVSAAGIIAFDRVQEIFQTAMESGGMPKSTHGDAARFFKDANRFIGHRKGAHRVAVYNVLWDDDLIHVPDQRSMLNALTAKELAPEVIGLQECNRHKRDCLSDFSIVKTMAAAGYVEVPLTDVKNAWYDQNCTPVFYDPEQVECLDAHYVWYGLQYEKADPNDRSSKSMTWGLFRSKRNGDRYIFASTHMCTQIDDIREVQAKEACDLFRSLHEEYGVPVFVGGDFNANCSMKGYRYYLEKEKYKDVYRIAKSAKSTERSHHPYPALDLKTGLVMPTAGASYNMPEACIDHLLTGFFPETGRVNVHGILINSATLAGSDHFPVFADFDL